MAPITTILPILQNCLNLHESQSCQLGNSYLQAISSRLYSYLRKIIIVGATVCNIDNELLQYHLSVMCVISQAIFGAY